MIERFKNPEFLWNTLAQITQMIGALLIIKLLSVYLSKGEFGIYVLLNSILALFMILPFNAIIHGVARHVHEYNTTSKYKIFFSVSHISQVIIFIIIMIMTLIVIQFFEFNLKEYISILLVLIFSEIIKTTLRTIENTNRKRKKIAIASLLEFTSKIFIIYLSQIFEIISITNILYIIIFGNFLSVLILLINNYSNIKLKISKESILILTPMIIFALPLIASQLFGWVRDMSSRWIIQSYMDNESVAVFALMGTLAAIIPNGVYSLLGSFMAPIFYQKEESEKGYTKKILNTLIPRLCIGTIILFIPIYFLQEYIIIILSDKKYLEYSWMLPYMFLIFSVYIISIVASYNIYVTKKTKSLIYPSLFSAIVAFVSGIYFITTYGLIGALVSYTLTYMTYSFIIFYIVFKKEREIVC